MDVLFTAFAILCLSACGLCVYACIRHASDAHESADDLRKSRARLIALEHGADALGAGIEKLEKRLKALEGRFYQLRARVDENGEPEPHYGDGNEKQAHFDLARKGYLPDLRSDLPVCDNWQLAQLEGPRSQAAECQCAYCLTQRNARAAEKARILAERRPLKPVNGSE